MQLETIAVALGIISTTLSITAILGRWLVLIPLKNFIAEHTYPIQPNANGGKSLPDVAKTVIEIKTCVEGLAHQVDKIETRLDTHIQQHVKGEA